MSLEKVFRQPPNLSEAGSKYYEWLMSLSPDERKEYLAKQEADHAEKSYFCKTCKDLGFVNHPTKDINDIMFGKLLNCPNCKGKGKDVSHDRRAWELTFEHWFPRKGTEEAFMLSKQWANGQADFIWLLLYGAHGCGKTHLAKASQELLRKRGCKVININALQFFDDLRQAIEDKNINDRLKLYQEVEYLILDDFFLDTKSDWLPAKSEQTLNCRYENYLPTMLTMNDNPDTLTPAIFSRFKDKERSRIVLNQAGDYRPSKRMGVSS